MDQNIPYPDSMAWGPAASTEHNLHDRLAVAILCLGGVALGESWKHQDLSSPFWRLYLNKRDGAQIRHGREWVPLRAGRLYLIPAWVSYATTSAPGVEHIYVHFDLTGPSTPVVRELFPRPLALADLPARARRLITIGDRVARGEPPGPELVLSARSVVDEVLAEAVVALPSAQRERLAEGALHGGPLGRVLAQIEADPGGLRGNAALASIAGCSSDHLIRQFRRDVGVSPAAYVAERRLATAARALAFSDEGLDVIAARCGFANRFSFTRAFTRQFGVPPARWRRRGG